MPEIKFTEKEIKLLGVVLDSYSFLISQEGFPVEPKEKAAITRLENKLSNAEKD